MLVTVNTRDLRSDLSGIADTEHEDVTEIIEGYLRNAASEFSGIPCDYEVVSGEDASESLIEFQGSDDSIRMAVTATHGRSGLERWRLGSITERVVRHSEVPILVVPTRTH